MTKRPIRRCAWCGGAIPDTGGPGRPRLYCRRSHRQRAFEARRAGTARGLDTGEALVRAESVGHLRDRMYLLRVALEDAEADLRADPSRLDLLRALSDLVAAAREAAGSDLEVLALGDP